MKRTWILAITILAVIAVIAGAFVLINMQGLPLDAGSALTVYLSYRYPAASSPTIQQVSRASRPWLFKAELSGASYGDNSQFRTTFNLGATTSQARPRTTATLEVSLTPVPSGDSRPLIAYPPDEAWCVLLGPGGEEPARVVLVALHLDLYRGEWIVHEIAGSSSAEARRAALDEIGCGIKAD